MALKFNKERFNPVAPSQMWDGHPEARNFVYAIYFPGIERVELYSKYFKPLGVCHPEKDALRDFVMESGAKGCMFSSKSIKTFGWDSAKREFVPQSAEVANPLEGIAAAADNSTAGEDLEG